MQHPLFFVGCPRPKESICQGQMLLKGDAALRLLTHHQPGGWSPALEKGGYTLGLAPIAFQYKGSSPRTVYPPFARAGVSMRSMGGGLAAPAAFPFNKICLQILSISR